jgi:hypothetical protein
MESHRLEPLVTGDLVHRKGEAGILMAFFGVTRVLMSCFLVSGLLVCGLLNSGVLVSCMLVSRGLWRFFPKVDGVLGGLPAYCMLRWRLVSVGLL